MLTGDLIRVRLKEGTVLPYYLQGPAQERLGPIAAELIEILQAGIGETRGQVEQRLDRVDCRPSDRIIVAGLKKLLLDRCELSLEEGLDPAALREAVFTVAAAARQKLDPRESFDREAVVREVARQHGLDPGEIEGRLFADLKGNERLISFRPIDSDALLRRYDVGLAQAVLLRATKVTVWLDKEAPGRVRQLFRAARFHGLLHLVYDLGGGSYRIDLDGPFSLFSAVKRYGLKLALFLPSVLRTRRFRLQAELLWGKRRTPMTFELTPEQQLRPEGRRVTGVAPALGELCDKLRQLSSDWDVAEAEEIFAVPGEPVCVPDLVFENRQTGEVVYLEAFGFWSRDAVFQRLETLERLRRSDSGGFPGRIILAVGKQLRVSRQLLDDDDSAELYIYQATMSPRAILKRLDGK